MTSWTVLLADEFGPEFRELDEEVQDEILVQSRLLQQFGPNLGRPRVDTLKASRHANMKELCSIQRTELGASPLLLLRSDGQFFWLPR